jgi:prepilin-type N-terminal cleavage/methylation domain-containing protein
MRAGFSLLELVVVISLIVILCSIAIGGINLFDRLIVRSELDLLYLRCKQLQQEALLTRTIKELIFDRAGNGYSFGSRHHTFNKAVCFLGATRLQGPPSEPTHRITSAVTFVHDRIVFYPDGIISSGAVYLCDARQKVVYALSNAVSQVSYLRRYVYDKTWVII